MPMAAPPEPMAERGAHVPSPSVLPGPAGAAAPDVDVLAAGAADADGHVGMEGRSPRLGLGFENEDEVGMVPVAHIPEGNTPVDALMADASGQGAAVGLSVSDVWYGGLMGMPAAEGCAGPAITRAEAGGGMRAAGAGSSLL